MNALENAKKLSSEEVLEKIAALDIQEYGLCAQSKLHTKKFAVSNLSEYGYCVF